MDTPRVALRFKDVVTDIDTIEEHQRIITTEGAVWWGWWKKEKEPRHDATFAQLASAPGVVLLHDSRRGCTYRADYRQVAEPANIDRQRIPSYYRSKCEQIPRWLLLTAIAPIPETEAPKHLGRRFAGRTLVSLDVDDSEIADIYAPPRDDRTQILHLSDLHFGADFGYQPPDAPGRAMTDIRSLTHVLASDLEHLGLLDKIGLLVITGDITTRGDWSDDTRGAILLELRRLIRALDLAPADVVLVPGNHDIVRIKNPDEASDLLANVDRQVSMSHETPFVEFRELLTGVHDVVPLNYRSFHQIGGRRVVVAALNSCAITATRWTEYGFVNQQGLDTLDDPLAVDAGVPLGILALHHHVVPVNDVEALSIDGVSMTLNAVKIIDLAIHRGYAVILHGHQHRPRITRLNNLALESSKPANGSVTIVSGGSVSVARSRLGSSGHNTYSVLGIDGTTTRLRIRRVQPDGRLGWEQFDGVILDS